MSPSDTVRDLETVRAEALGLLLGVVDAVVLARKHPSVFNLDETIDRLDDAKTKHDAAQKAYLDARLAQ